MKPQWTALSLLALALLFTSLMGRQAAIAQAEPTPNQLTTPQLIEAAQTRGDLSPVEADLLLAYALFEPGKLPETFQSGQPWDGTLPLLQLRAAMTKLPPSAARSQIETLVNAACSSSTSTLPNTIATARFFIEYGSIGGGLTINEYSASLETTWSKMVDDFGWAAPLSTRGDGRYHVRIDSLYNGLYGYVSSDGTYAGLVGDNPNTAWNEGDAYASCMVLNRDYSYSGFPSPPQPSMDATVAHEFNHSIQYGYGALTGSNAPDSIFIEGGASWVEDELFDSADDNYYFLWPTFSSSMGAYVGSPYAYWIVFRGLTEPFGTGTAGGGEQIMQDFWELISQNGADDLTALDQALQTAGTNLPDAYHAMAIAAHFLKPCGGGYLLPYCFEEASGYVAVKPGPAVHRTIAAPGSSVNGSIPNNYALNWVSLPADSGVYDVTLTNNSGSGQFRASLVCDTGSALTITPFPALVGGGQQGQAAAFDSTGCVSAAAIITNQEQAANNSDGYSLATSAAIPPGNERLYLPLVAKASAPITQLANGGFEDGRAIWQTFSTHNNPIIRAETAVSPHQGNWLAQLGGADDETTFIEQQVTVPAVAPYLHFWYWIESEDNCGFYYDVGRIVVNETAVVDTTDLCNQAMRGQWQSRSIDLSRYRGQTITIRFQVQTDNILSSSLFIDDVMFRETAVTPN